MGEREEFVRLALLEGANRRELCQRFGISAEAGYKWLRRAAAGEGLAERSRRPLSSPWRSAAELEQAVTGVREEHPAWGARKIKAVLERRGLAVPATSTVHAILARHGLILPKRSGAPAHLRFERDRPNELWQMDFKGALTLGNGQRLHPLTVVDDHSRYCPCLAACADQTEETVKTRLIQVFRWHGLPEAMFVDNGSPWGDSRGGEWTRFRVWLLKLGVQLINARPFHPQSRGKNERFHRSMDEEVFAMRPLTDHDQAQHAFDRWRDVYNHQRPHEGIAMQRPAERYQPSPRPMPGMLPEPQYGEGETVKRVARKAPLIRFKGKRWRLPKSFRGEPIAIRPHGIDGTFGFYFGANLIKTIDLRAPEA
jgi:transposase InsO family protein